VYPLDIIQRNEHYTDVTQFTQLPKNLPVVQPPTTWEEYINIQHPWEATILTNATSEITRISLQIYHDNTIWHIASDGSYKDHRGAYAWILSDGNTKLQQGTGLALGNPATAYRSELYGITAWYCCLYHVMKYFGIRSSKIIQPYSDNTKVIATHKMILTSQTVTIWWTTRI